MKMQDFITQENINFIVDQAEKSGLTAIRFYKPIVEAEKNAVNLLADMKKDTSSTQARYFQWELEDHFQCKINITTETLKSSFMFNMIKQAAVTASDLEKLQQHFKDDNYNLDSIRNAETESQEVESDIVKTCIESLK